MNLLVINCGSSSIKFSVFRTNEGNEPQMFVEGELTGVNRIDANLAISVTGRAETHAQVDASTASTSIEVVMEALSKADLPAVDAVGYRVVHPGSKLDYHTRLTHKVLKDLDAAAEFAPLHDPPTVQMIRSMMKSRPNTPCYACFDTVFHETMPEEAKVYAIPNMYRERGIRRYGFHGLSCESIVRRVRLRTGEFPQRSVIAHLGSGCSVTALVAGCSIDNTMGLTPTGGVVMGSRPGDLDPSVVLCLLRRQKDLNEAASAVEKMLNQDSGMVALSGMVNDVRVIRETAANGNALSLLTLKVFTRSVRKAIGAYAWLLGGLDAVIFSGGIGEHDALTRTEVIGGLETFDIEIDESANQTTSGEMKEISAAKSKTKVWMVPAEEDLMIALHVERMMLAGD